MYVHAVEPWPDVSRLTLGDLTHVSIPRNIRETVRAILQLSDEILGNAIVHESENSKISSFFIAITLPRFLFPGAVPRKRVPCRKPYASRFQLRPVRLMTLNDDVFFRATH
jgi:hypothetical protein